METEINDAMTIRRQRVARIQVRDCLSATLDTNLFLTRRVAMTPMALEMMEQRDRLVHCPACVVQHPVPQKCLEFSFMFSSFGDDPLQNFWKMVELACAHCGAAETIAVDKPAGRERNFSNYSSVLGTDEVYDSTDPWQKAIREEEEKDKLRFVQSQRQAGKSAMLGAMYGSAGLNSHALNVTAFGGGGGGSSGAIAAQQDIYSKMQQHMVDAMSMAVNPAVMLSKVPPPEKTATEIDIKIRETLKQKRGILANLISPKKSI